MRRPPDDGRRGRRHLSRAASPRARLVALFAVLLAASACSRGATVDATGSAIATSGPIPSLAGEVVGAGTLDTAAFAGRVVVVNFWATWCGPCRREQPVLSAVRDAAGPVGPAFVGVNYRDDEAAAAAYPEEFDVAYPSLSDPSGTLAFAFGVPYLPATFVADADGRLRFRVVGEIDRETLEDLIARASEPA
ncbi:MAG: TlpA family protein disulfide reductase [Actinomycetota bacterium]